MYNEEIRMCLGKYRFYQWELAEWLGISQSVLIRHFRKELPDDIKQQILNVIECVHKQEPYDNSFFHAYLRSKDRRYGGRSRTAISYSRYIEKGLDEAERRRMEGGWDLSL